MARPKKNTDANEKKDDIAKVEPSVAESVYTVTEAAGGGFLIRHGDTPVYIAPSEEEAKKYISFVER